MKLKAFLGICLLVFSGIFVQAQEESFTLDHDGEERSYNLVIPEDFDAEAENALLIVLHGAGGNGADMLFGGGFNDLAAANNMIVAYPDGILKGWNYLDEEQLHPADTFTNDVEFLPLLIDTLVEEYELDASQVYIAGYSNGGMMALRMMCDYGENLAGVGVIAANFSYRLVEHCLEVTPTPLVIALGTEDASFPWHGFARMREDGFFRARFSVGQMMGFLTTLYRCESPDTPQRIEASDSRFAVISDSHSDCDNDAKLALYALVDHTHQYPIAPRITLSDGSSGTIMAAMFDFWGLKTADDSTEAPIGG